MSTHIVLNTVAGGAGIVLATAVLYGARQLGEVGKNVKLVKEVVLGEPASLGIPARPGVIERVANVEQAQAATDRRVDDIAGSVNGLSGTVSELSKVVHEIKGAVMSNAPTVILPSDTKQ